MRANLVLSLFWPLLVSGSPLTALSGTTAGLYQSSVPYGSRRAPLRKTKQSPIPPFALNNSTHNLGTAVSGFGASTGSIRSTDSSGYSRGATLPTAKPSTGGHSKNSQLASTEIPSDSSQPPIVEHLASPQSAATDTPSDLSQSPAEDYPAGLQSAVPNTSGNSSQSSDSFDHSFQPSGSSGEYWQSSASSGATQPMSSVQSSPSASTTSSVFIPPWNSMNVTCDDFNLLVAENPAEAWSAVDGDGTLQTFNLMYTENQLVCQECYGMVDPKNCKSTNPTCQNGLREMNGTTTRRDTAASIFTQTGPDVACDLDGSSQCQVAPTCQDRYGPAGVAIMKSLTTMHNSLQNVYDAIEDARSSATDQMGRFSKLFAPVPSMKDKAIWMEIMFVIAGLIAGVVPGLGEAVTPMLIGAATAGGLMVGVGSAVVMNDMIFNQPTGADTASFLDTITNNIRGAYSDVADSLFTNGSYDYPIGDGQGIMTKRWADIMAEGALLKQDVNTTNGLQLVYERVLYQQLAVHTWQNLEVDNAGHLPFIAFDNKTCDQIDHNKAPLEKFITGVGKSDTNVTYNGSCYYLLDGTTVSGSEGHGVNFCTGKPLPGGTNKDMTDNSEQFANLTLADFVIPSVKGWQNHTYQNGYDSIVKKGSIFTDPQAQGVVNLPVCDYLGNPNSPGIGCPKLRKSTPKMSKSCEAFSPSTGSNQPGQFVDGSCGVHIQQWQKTEGDQNPLGSYQLSVTVLDGAGRPVGEATKQSAAESLEIVDSALPYDLIVATGDVDSSPILFWYSDQYWNSSSTGTGKNTNHCAVGPYDHGSRKMDCGFSCPFPDNTADPPVSATVDNPFPNTPIPAMGGDTTFLNTFITSRPATPTAPVAPYPTGWCGVDIRQYQKNEGNSSSNNTPNYKIEVTLKGGDMKPIAAPEALQPAPSGQPISIPGLTSPFTVTAGGLDSEPLTISFAGKTWQTNRSGHTCKVSGFKDGYRDLDCRFDC